MKIHDIYPSTKADPKIIAEYGWEFVEDIPTTLNAHGRLAPTPDQSAANKELRTRIEEQGVAAYVTETGDAFWITDYAISDSPVVERTLGMFVIKYSDQ